LRHHSAPYFAGEAFTSRLLFPVRAHVNAPTARTTLGAHDLAREERHLTIVGIFRDCRSGFGVGVHRRVASLEDGLSARYLAEMIKSSLPVPGKRRP